MRAHVFHVKPRDHRRPSSVAFAAPVDAPDITEEHTRMLVSRETRGPHLQRPLFALATRDNGGAETFNVSAPPCSAQAIPHREISQALVHRPDERGPHLRRIQW